MPPYSVPNSPTIGVVESESEKLESESEKLESQYEKLESESGLEKLVAPQAGPWEYEIVPGRIIYFFGIHILGAYGLYLCFTRAMWATMLFNVVTFTLGVIGVTAGAHRLWSHRAYKANLPLQILLMLMNSLAFQYTASNWARDHRLHHRYSDTDADPHNATRGFFFSHIGWLLVKKHPEVAKRGKLTDMTDIYANPVLRFQDKYAYPLIGFLCFVFPTILPVYCWGETFTNAWHVNMLRFVLSINAAFSINSLAHLFGTRPYDRTILPVQNWFVSLVCLGEGFHNYHHAFPWDYRAGELGNNWLNVSAKFIDLCAWVGWARELRTAPGRLVRARMERVGEGTNTWGFK